MNNYKQYINALRACAKEHKDDVTPFAHIRVSDMCSDVANLLEGLEQEPKWIPMTKRPMTEEETEHYFEYTDMRIDDAYTILDCPLPEDGQEVLTSSGGYVCVDTFCIDNGCYFEGVDIDDVDAWMPLPEPYNAESEVQE